MNATSTASDTARDVRESLKEEIPHGGDQEPCPFCGIPRVQRSDYVRCCGCGINWSPGEDMSKHPSIERYQKMVASQRKTKADPLNP